MGATGSGIMVEGRGTVALPGESAATTRTCRKQAPVNCYTFSELRHNRRIPNLLNIVVVYIADLHIVATAMRRNDIAIRLYHDV